MLSVKKDRLKSVEGRICPGMGAARANVAAQLPKIVHKYPIIKECFPGTINILLSQSLTITKPDLLTDPIEWMPGVAEKFSLTQIEFEFPLGGPSYPAWIYNPQFSPHRHDAKHIELIAHFILGISQDTRCRIQILRSKGRIT